MGMIKLAAGVLLAATAVSGAQATITTLSENFEDVPGLGAAGWVYTNNSASPFINWFGGNQGVFGAQAGSAGSYVAASFLSSGDTFGTIDNWLISPEFDLAGFTTLSFWTRASDAGFFDKLEVRFSSGPGSDVAGFSTLLTTIGSDSSATYPARDWTPFSLGLPSATTGRVAFRYVNADASSADYIGIDTVSVTAVPEPVSAALAVLALGMAAGASRRRPQKLLPTPTT